MGHGSTAKCVGLFYKDEMISCLSYRKIEDGLDIARFATKENHQVAGGLSKLINYIQQKEDPVFIQSFVDLRYGNGSSLETIGWDSNKPTLGWSWSYGFMTRNRLSCKANMDSRRMTENQPVSFYQEIMWQLV